MRFLLTAAAILLALPALAQDNPLRDSATWDDIRESVVGLTAEPPIDPAVIDLDAPFRAHEAAIVPIRMTQPANAPALTRLALIVDENPAPVAAEFTLGPALTPLDFETRVRVDSYSGVRAIATTADGAQVMAGRFVRASGGCSAPAGKDMAAVRETMGQMRWRSTPEGDRAIGTLMIRHPNFSGLQRDQVTLLTIPAHFIQTLTV
ncbi:MAG: quinoprotein dehydrogenase-associated SoxYZ-like carrier, partial [Paracoccus sp. (in: a-proteobacteria)]|nr:quinoprotein dehydrogenase-associated SoxYZ-like carrier [Paracoccus sp. (in: a-proteobacteria)]